MTTLEWLAMEPKFTSCIKSHLPCKSWKEISTAVLQAPPGKTMRWTFSLFVRQRQQWSLEHGSISLQRLVLGHLFTLVPRGEPQPGVATMRSSSGDVPAISKPVLGASWLDPCWNPSGASSSGGRSLPQTGPGVLPPSLSRFPADSGFIERAAAGFLCFGATSSGGMAADPFGTSRSPRLVSDGRIQKIGIHVTKPLVDASMTKQKKGRWLGVEPGQAELGGGGHERGASSTSAAENSSSKRSNEDAAMDRTPGDPQISAETKNRQSKHFSEDYVHVRARHGQATNSHSLAERVRREKISQRMKLLQELVPGCSKVTGKALMLDEIINYVQSLQQQVEFLSMKLATVDPRLDMNIEALLSEDQLLRSHGGSSSAVGFSPRVVDPQLHLSQRGLVQTGMFGDLNTANSFRRAIDSQLSSYKRRTTQMPISCDEELQNVMQMATFCSNHFNNREFGDRS